MLEFAVRRAGQSVLALLILLSVVFAVSRLTGDPANLYLPVTAPEEAREAFRQAFGLNDPFVVQFGRFVMGLLTLDFGESLYTGLPALQLVLQRLPATAVLAGTALVISVLVSIPLGLAAARRPGSLIDRLQQLVSLAGMSMPTFWLAILLIVVFAVTLGWLPTSGTGGWQHVVLPALSLAARPIGMLSQVARSGLLEQLKADHIRTAISKGMSERRVLARHALRNSLTPYLIVASDQILRLLNGSVVIEVIFGWPGIGSLTIEAVIARDFPVLLAIVFVVSVIIVAGNFIVDLIHAALDPRVRIVRA